jgi:hypothetical protein
MKIGVFVHSKTGNTARLALAVTHALREKGHDVAVELLRPIGKVNPGSRHVEFRNLPDAADFEMVLIGGPIWAFSASPVVTSAIKQIPGLKGKRALYFLTSFLPPPISGCKRAHDLVSRLLKDAGSAQLEGCSLSWGLWCSKKRLNAAVEEICATVLGTAA